MTALALFVDNATVASLARQFDGTTSRQRRATLVELAWYLRQRDPERARALAEEALALVDDGPESSAAVLRARLSLVTAEAHWLFAEHDAAERLAERCLLAFAAAGDAAGEVDAHWLLAHAAYDRGDRARRDRHFELAHQAAMRGDDAQRADFVTAAKMYWAALDGKHDAIVDWDEMVARLSARDDAALTSWVDDCRGFVAFQGGDQGQAALHLMAAHAAAAATGQVWRAITIATNVGVSFSNLNDFDAALEWVQRGLEMARATGWPGRIALCLIQVAREMTQLGRAETARTMLTEALGHLAKVPESRNYAIALLYLGEVELDLGHPEAALGWFSQARERTTSGGADYHLRGQTTRGRAVALAALGRTDAAFAEAADALAVAEQVGDGSSQIEALRVLADIRLAGCGREQHPSKGWLVCRRHRVLFP